MSWKLDRNFGNYGGMWHRWVLDIGIKKAGVTAVLGLHKAIYKVHATKVTTTNFTAG